MAALNRTLDLFPGLSGGVAPAATPLLKVVSAPPGPAADPDARQLWLGLLLPGLAFEALGLGSSLQARTHSIVVIETEDREQCVAACNGAAARHGIAAGMSLNAAHALTEHLEVHERHPGKEQVFLEQLAQRAGRFTPRVSLVPPDALLLEIGGSLQLFGGLQSLHALIDSELGRQAVISIAPLPRAALWLARAGLRKTVLQQTAIRGALADVPLEVTRWPQKVLDLLGGMGIHSLGECLRLPRDGLARRIGADRVQELEQASGGAVEVRSDHRPQQRFRAMVRPEMEIVATAQLQEALQKPLQQLVDFLARRQAAIQALAFSLKHRSCPDTRQVLRFAAPVNDFDTLSIVLQEHLGRLRLSAPIACFSLRSGRLLAAATTSQRLSFNRRGDPFRQAESPAILRLFEMLRARFGEAAVYRLQTRADHRPEKAVLRQAGLQQTHSSLPAASGRRPLWLLASPEGLHEQQGWPLYRGALAIEQGPERIESGWWDGAEVARDYYVAHTPSGLRVWIYRDRHPPHGWFLHGFFG